MTEKLEKCSQNFKNLSGHFIRTSFLKPTILDRLATMRVSKQTECLENRVDKWITYIQRFLKSKGISNQIINKVIATIIFDIERKFQIRIKKMNRWSARMWFSEKCFQLVYAYHKKRKSIRKSWWYDIQYAAWFNM